MRMLLDWYDFTWFIVGRVFSPAIILCLIVTFIIMVKQLCYGITCAAADIRCEKSILSMIKK